MSTMCKCRTLAEARTIARQSIIEARNNGTPAVANVLRTDGNTEVYQCVGRVVTRTTRSGHYTRGMHVDPCDLPCVV